MAGPGVWRVECYACVVQRRKAYTSRCHLQHLKAQHRERIALDATILTIGEKSHRPRSAPRVTVIFAVLILRGGPIFVI